MNSLPINVIKIQTKIWGLLLLLPYNNISPLNIALAPLSFQELSILK